MDHILDELYRVLQKLLGLQRQLLDVVRQEREAMVSADLKGIQEATFSKEAVVDGIRHAESERQKIAAQLANFLQKPVDDLSLQGIIIAIQGKDQKRAEQFRSTFNALTLLIARINRTNEDNRAFVQQSLETIEVMKKNVLGESIPHSNTYTAQGQKSAGSGNSRLISREA